MKALTLTQPWATLVAIGAKKIETRSWSTTYRGPLAIHAAKGFPDTAQVLCFNEPFRTVLKAKTSIDIIWDKVRKESDFPLGCIVATCELVDVRKIHIPVGIEKITLPPGKAWGWEWYEPSGIRHLFEHSEQERAFGDYTEGRYAWLLHNIQPLPVPIPAKGALSLWEWDGTGQAG